MIKRILRKNFGAGFIIILFILSIILIHSTSAEAVGEKIVLSFSFTEPEITEKNISSITYHRVSVQNLYNINEPGFPILPMKSLKILLPQKGVQESINVAFDNESSLGNGYNVELGNFSSNSSQANESNYNSTVPYPGALYEKIGIYD
jgi:hypothetical protein